MTARFPTVLVTGSPNQVKELPVGDTIDPASSGLTGAYVGTTDTQTLTNKTLTAPKVSGVLDTAGAEVVDLTATASAVNQLVIANSATGNAVTISTAGDDASIALNLAPKAGAAVTVNGSALITASSTTTLTNKTHTEPRFDTTAGTHSCSFNPATPGSSLCDTDGNVIMALLDPGTTGVYLGIRNQVSGGPVTGGPTIFGCGADTDISVLLQPKGAGLLRVRTPNGAGNATVLNATDLITPYDYHAITLPGGSASTLGYIPGGLRIGGAGQTVVAQAVDFNVIQLFPFFAPHNGTNSVTVTGFSVSTGAANAVASNLRVAIYSNNSGTTCYPGVTGTSLISGSEVIQAIPGTASTVVSNTAMTATLTPGALYWMAFLFETDACIMACHASSTPVLPIIGARATAVSGEGYFHATASAAYTGWVANMTYGAYPANASGFTGSLEHRFSVNSTAGPNIMHLIRFGS